MKIGDIVYVVHNNRGLVIEAEILSDFRNVKHGWRTNLICNIKHLRICQLPHG